jgi:hypothetical protein
MKHNFPEYVNVTLKQKCTINQIKELLKLAIDQDINIASGIFKDLKKDNTTIFWDGYNEICVCQNDPIDACNTDLFVSLKEFKAFFEGKGKYTLPFNETLELNSEYKAEVTKENIKVGCQTFSHNKVAELYKLSQKALKSK